MTTRILYFIFVFISYLYLMFFNYYLYSSVKITVDRFFSPSESNIKLTAIADPDNMLEYTHKSNLVFNQMKVVAISPEIEYGPSIVKNLKEINPNREDKVFYKVRCNYFANELKAETIVLAIHENGQDKAKIWMGKEFREINDIPGQWNNFEYVFELPTDVKLSDDNVLKLYIWNKEKNTFYINNLSITQLK